VFASTVFRETIEFGFEATGSARFAEAGDAVEIGGGQTECLADIADGGAKAIGGEGTDEGGVVGAEDFVDALDHFLANFTGEVDIDVGDRVELLVQEATQIEVVLDGIDGGEANEVADDGGDR
jgi:hypothetical protein